MFWNKISPVYDLFENVYNRKVYKGTGIKVSEFIDETDSVLECACGTGAITEEIAKKAQKVLATDFAEGMLKRASKKCRKNSNVSFRQEDITDIKSADCSFDKAVAGNVIHLLPEPEKALNELLRVVKPGGKVIIPTYINMLKKPSGIAVSVINKMGADFKRQFDLDSYKDFFEEKGFRDVEYYVVEGRMPCAIAVITKK